MEETNTTNISLNYTTFGYVNNGEKSEYNCSGPSIETLVHYGFCMGISVFGLVGNGTVMWFLIFHMKQNPFTVYVLNLAIADFSVLLIVLLTGILDIISRTYCDLLIVFLSGFPSLFFFYCFFYFCSMYLLTAMSVERCLAVLFPIWYRCQRPKHLSGIVCGLLWALIAFFATLFLTHCRYNGSCGALLEVFLSVNFVIFSSFPLLSNLCLFIKLQCGSQRRYPGRVYLAVLISLICFCIFGLPFSMHLFLPNHYSIIFALSPQLTSLNSSINPIIYVLVGSCQQRRFHCSVTLAFRQLFQEQAASQERSPVPGEPVLGTCV